MGLLVRFVPAPPDDPRQAEQQEGDQAVGDQAPLRHSHVRSPAAQQVEALARYRCWAAAWNSQLGAAAAPSFRCAQLIRVAIREARSVWSRRAAQVPGRAARIRVTW